jgi:transglutaminase-like putative cysteine protease
MAMSRSRLLVPATTAVALAGALAVVASAQKAHERRVLHEDLAAPRDQVAVTAKRIEDGVPVIGPDPSAQRNPTAIASQDRLLPEPDAERPPGEEEPVFGQEGFAVDRQTEARPDRHTGADSTLHYVEVFNPSIVPFKRMSALNTIDPDYTLRNGSRTNLDLPVGGGPRPGHDLFWGSIQVELKPGLDVPIPSVSPDMRILSYESTPQVALTFSKDGADNYYLRTDETGRGGQYRVIFLSEASPSYFAPEVPRGLRVRDIPHDFLQPVPDAVREVATRALDELRVHDGMKVKEALDILVYYFRDFEAKTPPPDGGDIYWDLFETQAGVCRHRSFAFMVTANTLGIPTRYVTNEAHAWVEVWLPGEGWMRIDLGGAANTLEVSNASDKSMYRPRGDDPFAKPERYEENYTRLEGDVRGLRDDQIADRQRPYEGDDGSRTGNGSFFGSEDGGDEAGDIDDPDEDLVGPGEELPALDDDPSKEPTFIKVQQVINVDSGAPSRAGYRGETLMVAGRVIDGAGTGIAEQRVNIFLAPEGREGNDPVLVGRGVTDATGSYRAEIEIPTELELRRYEVYATAQGDDDYQASASH